MGTRDDVAALGFVDLDLVCVECGAAFVWTAGEQLFYEQKGLRAPRRCVECRDRHQQHLHEIPDRTRWRPS